MVGSLFPSQYISILFQFYSFNFTSILESVVAESVVVIKRLLQTQAADPKDIIICMVKLLDSITVPQARAAILWLLGEHCKSMIYLVPDVLRKLAKTFAEEVRKYLIISLKVLIFLLFRWF